jgi:DNA-binding MarR family transcriptional regulator
MPIGSSIEIYDLIKEVMHVASARIQQNLRSSGVVLGPIESRCLNYVSRHPSCTQNDIVKASGRDKAQIARVAKILLDRGDLKRLPDQPGEKRHRLSVTPSGARLNDIAERHRQAIAYEMLSALSAQERKTVAKLLRRIVHTLADSTVK